MHAGRLALISIVIAACVGLGIAAATGAFSGSGHGGGSPTSATSPPCLPSSPNASAKLPGVPVDVSPAPETGSANPRTQISFLGVPAAQIREVSVSGERSGVHAGGLHAYSQGDGASFAPSSPFDAGEQVHVHAMIGASASARPVAFSFRVDTPYPTASVPPFPNPPAPAGESESFRTLPGVSAPTMTVTTPDRDPTAGDILMTNGPGPGAYGALIYTPQGRLVWFDQLAGGTSAENLSVQSYAGAPRLTLWQGKVLSLGYGEGEDLVLDSSYQPVARVAGGNGLKADLHEFQIAPHGVAYITAYNAIRCDLASVEGARDGTLLDTAVQEIDMKTGLVRWEWHSVDHVAVADSQTAAPSSSTAWDWFHINSIDPQPDGRLLISARSTWATYELEGGSGRILWRLGGTRSSFKMGPGTETAWQHDGRMLPNGEVTLFDDGSNPPVHRQSRGVRIAIDPSTHEAHLTASYTHPAPLLSVSQGNMQTLPEGNVVLDYGSIPELAEYAPDGSLLFDAHLALDMDNYRGLRFPWHGRPSTPPALAANLNNTSEQTIVHASWNGATDVAKWRVLAGKSAQGLRAQSTIPATSFESEAILPEKWAYVAVQALDGAGHVLASSNAVPVASFAESLASTSGTKTSQTATASG
jgi:Arylsulfotransferase (ASST)